MTSTTPIHRATPATGRRVHDPSKAAFVECTSLSGHAGLLRYYPSVVPTTLFWDAMTEVMGGGVAPLTNSYIRRLQGRSTSRLKTTNLAERLDELLGVKPEKETMDPWPPTIAMIAGLVAAQDPIFEVPDMVAPSIYRDHADRIDHHVDDPWAVNFGPRIEDQRVALVSLGGTRHFEVRKISHEPDKEGVLVFPLQAGSLLVMEGAFQHCYTHALDGGPPEESMVPRLMLQYSKESHGAPDDDITVIHDTGPDLGPGLRFIGPPELALVEYARRASGDPDYARVYGLRNLSLMRAGVPHTDTKRCFRHVLDQVCGRHCIDDLLGTGGIARRARELSDEGILARMPPDSTEQLLLELVAFAGSVDRVVLGRSLKPFLAQGASG